MLTPMYGGGGVLPGNLGGVCGALLETLTLSFQTKISDFPYPISDQTKNPIPYFRPDYYPISFESTFDEK